MKEKNITKNATKHCPPTKSIPDLPPGKPCGFLGKSIIIEAFRALVNTSGDEPPD